MDLIDELVRIHVSADILTCGRPRPIAVAVAGGTRAVTARTPDREDAAATVATLVDLALATRRLRPDRVVIATSVPDEEGEPTPEAALRPPIVLVEDATREDDGSLACSSRLLSYRLDDAGRPVWVAAPRDGPPVLDELLEAALGGGGPMWRAFAARRRVAGRFRAAAQPPGTYRGA